MKKNLLLIIVIFIILANVALSEDSKLITLDIKYSQSGGVVKKGELIGYSVENTVFNWAVNYDKVCTKWEIYSFEADTNKQKCYGANGCCSFLELNTDSGVWNESMYLQYNVGGVTENNRVTGRVVYVDFSLDPENAYSDIHYSEEDYLYGVFSDSDGKAKLNNNQIEIMVTSPVNNSIYGIGEDIYLNFSMNISAPVSYSLDDYSYYPIGDDSEFVTLINGTLDFSVVKNGVHELKLFILVNSTNFVNYSVFFKVDDEQAPTLKIDPDLDNTVIDGSDSLNINFEANEYTWLVYNLNDENSKFLRLGKEGKITVNPDEGSNTLTINYSDMQGNYLVDSLDFDFKILPTCSDGVKNGDETGIDCGGSCNSCVDFNVTLEKEKYNISESVKVTVLARENAAVNLSVYLGGAMVHNDYITSYSPGFPIFVTKPIYNINKEGNYVIVATMIYKNNTEDKLVYFSVVDNINSPLSVVISANASNVNEGQHIRFSSSVTGGNGGITYNWKFGDGFTSTSSALTHWFNKNKTYEVNLTVKNAGFNASDRIVITVRKLFNVTFIVTGEHNDYVKDSVVKFNGKEKNTSSTGMTSFKVNKGSYDIKIFKENYEIFTNSTEVEKNKTIRVNLTLLKLDNIAPLIDLISPDHNKTIKGEKVEIKYRVRDSTQVDCTLYTNVDESWWTEQSQHLDIIGDSERTFTLNNLDNRAYQWKIECIDNYQNSRMSDSRLFYITGGKEKSEDPEIIDSENSIDDLINIIQGTLLELDNFDKNKNDASEALALEEQLEKAKKNLERAKRDINNIVWRRLDETETEELRQSLLDAVDIIGKTTIKSFKIAESEEYVSYPSKEDVIDVSNKVMDATKKAKDSTKKEFAKQNQDIQDYISITTRIKILDVEYISGVTGKISLVEKIITENDKLKKISLIEDIPKTLAANTSHINALFEFSVVQEDPVIKVELPIDSYAYYFDRGFSIAQIKEIKTVLVKEDMETSTGITGFAVFTNLPKKLIETYDIRLIIEFIVILVLVLTYFAFSGGFNKLSLYIRHFGDYKHIKEINVEVDDALAKLKENHYDKAKEIYTDINQIFKDLPKGLKKQVFGRIKILGARLNSYYINKLLDKADFNLEQKHKPEALSIYNKVRGLYKGLPKKFKLKVIERCNQLHSKLAGK